MDKVRLGISACLLGQPVRYDGGHRLDPFLRDTLGRFVEWVPVCPEVEYGLPVPRPTLRLVGDPAAPRLVTTRTGVDHTEGMQAWAARRLRALAGEGLCGFVFKSRSPSSGMERVKVYDARGRARPVGVGLFARAFMDRFPRLPVEEEGRLKDPLLRDHFLERVFCLKRYRDFCQTDASRAGLVAFHADHKMQLMAHSVELARRLGRLVAEVRQHPWRPLLDRYEALLMEAMARRSTPAKHANVLQHMMGFFKKHLTSDDKRELLTAIQRYKEGLLPLSTPLALLNHYIRRFDEPYLKRQTYLDPYPLELRGADPTRRRRR